MAAKEKEREEKGLADYGIIYLSGVIGEAKAEEICKQLIEFNIKGSINQVHRAAPARPAFPSSTSWSGPTFPSTQPASGSSPPWGF